MPSIFFFHFCFGFGPHSGMLMGYSWFSRPIWDAWYRTQVGLVHGKLPTFCTIAIAPCLWVWSLELYTNSLVLPNVALGHPLLPLTPLSGPIHILNVIYVLLWGLNSGPHDYKVCALFTESLYSHGTYTFWDFIFCRLVHIQWCSEATPNSVLRDELFWC